MCEGGLCRRGAGEQETPASPLLPDPQHLTSSRSVSSAKPSSGMGRPLLPSCLPPSLQMLPFSSLYDELF